MGYYEHLVSFRLVCSLAVALWSAGAAVAQGDSCADAMRLDFAGDLACPTTPFDNLSATESGVQQYACIVDGDGDGDDLADVWFVFTPTRTVAEVTITGGSAASELSRPQFLVYNGTCDNAFFAGCASDLFDTGVASAVLYDLNPGEPYLLIVSGAEGAQGKFDVCIEQRQAVLPGPQDCDSALVVCDESAVVRVAGTFGPGVFPLETSNDGCFDGPEISSTWHKFTASSTGRLAFTITPDDPTDDFDFSLYRLSSIRGCATEQTLACMTSGPIVGADRDEWRACTGATGMRASGGDLREDIGCEPGDDNFVGSIELEAFNHYALLVVNASQSGRGYTLDFAGTEATFGSPEMLITTDLLGLSCGAAVLDINYVGDSRIGDDELSWDFGPNATPRFVEGRLTPSITFSEGGTQDISLIYSGSCPLVSGFEVQVPEFGDNLALDTAEVVRPGCEGAGSVRLAINRSDAIQYAYTTVGGTPPGGTQITPTFAGLSAGNYQFIARDVAGCVDTIAVALTGSAEAVELLAVDPFNGTCSSPNGSLEIKLGTGVVAPEYEVIGVGTQSSPLFTDLPPGEYEVVVRDPPLCAARSTATIAPPDGAPEIEPPRALNDGCVGATGRGRIEVTSQPPAGDAYTFALDGGEPQTTGLFDSLNAGTYALTITNAEGCTRELSVVVPEGTAELPPIDLGGPRTVRFSDSLTVSAELGEAFDYDWSATDPVRCLDEACTRISITATAFQTVSLLATDGSGCIATGRLEVRIRVKDFVGLPTAFSPNGDGVNDVWRPIPSVAVERVDRVSVFDRWGALVSRAIADAAGDVPGWNGTHFDGLDKAPVGVYAVLVEVTLRDGGTRVLTGDVTLVR